MTRLPPLLLSLAVGLGLIYSLYLRSAVANVSDSFLANSLRRHGPKFRWGEKEKTLQFEVIDVADMVNVFIGTTNGGHVFPGATLPHGMVKVGMDTDSPGNQAGYDALPQYKATGFSQLHDEGTGGWVPLSNFKIWPISSCPTFVQCKTAIENRKVPRLLTPDGAPADRGSPGYFATHLSNGVKVELTATRRTSLHRYTFDMTTAKPELDRNWDNRPRIVVDVTNDGRQTGRDAKAVIVPETGRVIASANFLTSFGLPDADYNAYSCTDFEISGQRIKPLEYGVYTYDTITPNTTTLPTESRGGGQKGAILTFPSNPTGGPTTILVRVGVSFISTDQACRNAEEEIPILDFDLVARDARKSWTDLLGRFMIDLKGVGTEHAVLFYSSLYRSHIAPADFTGENPGWTSDVPYYDSLYCNWDTYRTLFPLLSLHDPILFSKIVRSFIDIQQHEGWLPECRDAGRQQWVQGGTSGDPILAEFYIKFEKYAKNLKIDPAELWDALVQDAEVESPNWDLKGRQTEMWKKLGYLPVGDFTVQGGMNTRQVSRTLEYAFDDFAISQVAKLMDKKEEMRKYLNRSKGFENVWNPETNIKDEKGWVVPYVKGFMQPRKKDGSWEYTDPRHCTPHDPYHSTCYLDGGNYDGFYEGGPIVYSQYVPHDTARLIELQGGVESFIKRLDFIFDNGYFDSTNEPSQQMPFMYHYANQPGLSTERSRLAITDSFNTSVNGLPGNDDSGAMGSYVVFNLLGMYPLPATRQMLISSPFFPEVSIFNSLYNKTTTIRANGFEGNPITNVTGKKIYVKSIKIDSKPWKSNCYIEWEVFENGSTIDLELTNDRNVTCGSVKDAIPPSVSTGGYS